MAWSVVCLPAYVYACSLLIARSFRRPCCVELTDDDRLTTYLGTCMTYKTTSKMRRSITHAATAAALRRQPLVTSMPKCYLVVDSVSCWPSYSSPSSAISTPNRQRACHATFASDASTFRPPSFLAGRRRTLSTAGAACNDDCGRPCPEDCEGHVSQTNPSSQTNYFQILGLTDQSYNLDPAALKSKYKRLMGQYHPDRFHSLNDAAESGSEDAPKTLDELHQLSSSITRAYDVLSDPHARAEHLLELNNAAITENCSELVDMGLLMEVMEIREEIDSASHDAEVLRTLLGQNERRVENTARLLGRAFDEDGGDMDAARRSTAQLQYWKRIEEKIVDKLSTVK